MKAGDVVWYAKKEIGWPAQVSAQVEGSLSDNKDE